MKSRFKLYEGDNIESLKKLPDNSVDSVVTDGPYGLSFMGKKWDYDVPSVDFWKEVYRVLKPGGHVLSFGGTRTYHRMVVNIEDAGFEIRDQVMWLYGSGFPKSHNIGKAVDKLQGNDREVGKSKGTYVSSGGQLLGENTRTERFETKGTSEYEGWGTALKPANEPICVARKPLSEKTVALNVLKWGTGGINIDGCRIPSENNEHFRSISEKRDKQSYLNSESLIPTNSVEGRFPANIIFECICDEVIKGEKGEPFNYKGKEYSNKETSMFNGDKPEAPSNYNDKGDTHTNPMCPCRLLDEQSGYLKSGEVKPHHKKNKTANGYQGSCYGKFQNEDTTLKGYGDGGGASRFFYQAKVSKKERNMGLDPVEVFSGRPRREDGSVIYKETHPEEWKEVMNKLPRKDKTTLAGSEEKLQTQSTSTKNIHPTIKPVALMTYLCRLVTPVGGIVLDPFMGSGSTGISALLEGFRFVGMEMDPDYMKIAEARINNYEQYREFIKK